MKQVKDAPPGESSLEYRCHQLHTNDACGRGGEIRFQNYNDWVWHPALQLLDTGWTEAKTKAGYASAAVPSYHKTNLIFIMHMDHTFWWKVACTAHQSKSKLDASTVCFHLFTIQATLIRQRNVLIVSKFGIASLETRKQKKVILLDLIALEPEFALHGELSTFDGCATRTGHSTVTPGSLEKLLNVEMKKTKNKYSSTYIAVGSRLNIYKKCLLLKQVKPTAPKTCGLGECRGSRWGT
jgi:hypothetical protein